ncbi:MAG TPA: hypothetical protein DFS52_18470 [Myxococcales bacterium]|jgi:hypothetical protein|nr:hypothetical protein [Myxococcales bacterium]
MHAQQPSSSPGDSPDNGGFTPRVAQPKVVGGPRDKKEAAKEAFLDTVLNAKSLVLEMVEDFRASDRFFKYKASVVAGWVLLSLISLFVACPSSNKAEDTNELSARVRVQKVSALDRQITALYIENRSDEDWDVVLLKLNSTYSAAVPAIAAGRSAVIQLDKFSGLDGKTPPENLRPQKLDVRCAQGEATIQLTEGTP